MPQFANVGKRFDSEARLRQNLKSSRPRARWESMVRYEAAGWSFGHARGGRQSKLDSWDYYHWAFQVKLFPLDLRTFSLPEETTARMCAG